MITNVFYWLIHFELKRIDIFIYYNFVLILYKNIKDVCQVMRVKHYKTYLLRCQFNTFKSKDYNDVSERNLYTTFTFNQ